MKLRLAVTLLLVIIVIAIAMSIMAVDEEIKNDEEFYDLLSDDEIDQMDNIFSKYPESNTDSTYETAGLMMYVMALGLFILTVKLWFVKKI